jgi:hypothetical protein
MALEFIVASVALVAYLVGSYADEQRSRRQGRRLRPLKDADRDRMPAPSRP